MNEALPIEWRSIPSSWEDGGAKTITFIVTEGCQLSCKYCYLVNKNKRGRMNFDIAKKAIDYFLKERKIFNEKSVIWDFIGGEPLLEIELIDKVTDYLKLETYKKEHDWFENYRISLTTNGLLYAEKNFQRYIEKNKTHLDITISIDGVKEKHDLMRVYPDGKGSYDDTIKNVPLWLNQFPDASSKVTISSADIPYIRDSVIHLMELGIKDIFINVVFENVWQKNDDKLFEDQLHKLADKIIEYELYKNHSCSLFSDIIGLPINENKNWCGAGEMIAVDFRGNFYPCLRFAPYALQNKRELIIGNVYDGININKLRPFLTLDLITQSSEKCINCEVATGCAWCQAFNYDNADTDTIFQRATFICKMHKARVRANNYYWNKLKMKVRSKYG
jgi:uncharacterized protein